jgi:tRNA threonylcarbamoyladenosine biosynthesis protein TsaE
MPDRPHPDTSQIDCSLVGLPATERLAAVLAACFAPGFTLYLTGGLGAGKTALTRALLRSLGFAGRVRSPTFTLLEPYNLPKFELHHYDFYRLENPEAWREAGFEASFDGRVAVVVEWPEMAGGTLPAPDLDIELCIVLAADGTQSLRPLSSANTTGSGYGPEPEGNAAPSPEDCRLARVRAHSPRGEACVSRLHAEGFCGTPPGRGSPSETPG